MSSRRIAQKLIAARTRLEREKILAAEPRAGDRALAQALKNFCYEVWTTEPAKTRRASLALAALARLNADEEIGALALWVDGIADLTAGKMENAIARFDRSAAMFRQTGREHDAANTQVAKLVALALLGKYPEAFKTGRAALAVFEKYGDELAAGKIEKNLGNIVARQGKESAAEKFYLAARARFARIGEIAELAMSDNSLANTYAELNDFARAEEFYALALENARRERMRVTEAEIEASLGNLALFRGRLDEALRYLELSRRKYEQLKMPHQRAVAELEIADIYLELNLFEEAAVIYARVAPALKRLKMRGEEARARAGFGRTALARGEFKKASRELAKAADLFTAEKNPNGAAGVQIVEARLEISRGAYPQALAAVRAAEKTLAAGENRRLVIFAKWLRGEALRLLGRNRAAEKILSEALAEAEANEQANVVQLALNSLGRLALAAGDRRAAENHFRRAIRLIERQRAPLPAEEFRIAYLTDKIAPYQNLARIHLADRDFEKAFLLTEKARARTLAESLAGAPPAGDASPFAAEIETLREELNWFYSRLGRAEAGETEKLRRAARRREKQLADLLRQRASARGESVDRIRSVAGAEVDLAALFGALGDEKALVEYVKDGDSISAFVVTGAGVEYFADLAEEREIFELIEKLRFQFGALRYGTEALGAHLGELKRRADRCLAALYDRLLRPVENVLGARALIVVPTGALNYVPFHALKNADGYLVESREVSAAPSAAVWQALAQKPERAREKAVLFGYADEKIPLVEREIGEIRKIFRGARAFTGNEANFANYKLYAPDCDVLHLACHGQFRPDNPLFSSLRLADGFVTVRDICAQRLRASVVALSACETGLNEIAPGDEILGLARGFLEAGARALVLSLWTVSDRAAADLMREFYENLQRGASGAASLRAAQLKFIETNAHPYFWSPFALIGK